VFFTAVLSKPVNEELFWCQAAVGLRLEDPLHSCVD